MKKVIFLFGFFFLLSEAFGQKTEITVNAGSGLFYYRGNSSLQHTNYYIIFAPVVPPPFGGPGANPGLSSFIGLDIKQRFKKKFFWGTNFQAQRLTSKFKIDSIVYEHELIPSTSMQVKGHSSLVGVFAASDLYVGKTIKTKNISIDVSAGAEFSLQFSNNEKVKIKGSDSSRYSWTSSLGNNQFDLRLFISTNFIYKKLSLSIGYFYGIANYYGDGEEYIGYKQEAYSRFIKIGLGYRIK